MNQPRPIYDCVITVLALFLAGSNSFGQEAEVLRWKFKQGDTFAVTLIQNTKVNSQVDQRIKDVESVLTVSMSWNVKSVEPESGNATIEQAITRVQLSMTSLPVGVGKSINIDTDSSETKKGIDASLLKQVEPLVGATYEVVMSPRGELLDVTVPEETLATLRSAPGSLRLRSLMTASGMKDIFGQSMMTLPDAAPQANESWSQQSKIDTEAGKFVRRNAYNWTGNRREGDKTLADIKLVTSIEPDENNQTLDVKLISFSGNGNLVMNLTDGYFVSSKARNEMKTEKSYREKVISTTVTTTVEMRIEKE